MLADFPTHDSDDRTIASINPALALLEPLYVKTYENQVGTSVAPYPRDRAAVRMNRVRRLNGKVATMRNPDTATEANKNVVIPPRTSKC